MTADRSPPCGPLTGLKVIELAGLGPAPFCGMLLSDLGADVIRVDRAGGRYSPTEITARGRRSIVLDLKSAEGVEQFLALAERADGLIEGYRPGVMERLGLGPDVVLARNPRIAYGRMTGWGQSGPYAQMAGHDINFMAITGALHAIGTADRPVAPLNLVGDYGGGALYLAFGMLAAVLSARQTGKGQVVDCAMSEGIISMMSMFHGFAAAGRWLDQREANILDGGANFYRPYRCADGKWIALGAVEPQFYDELLAKAGLSHLLGTDRNDRANWPALEQAFAAHFATRTRAEWCELLELSDACFAPVLSMAEAPAHPHNMARQSFVERDGVRQAAPTPRFSATPGAIQGPPPKIGEHSEAILRDWGIAPAA